MTVLMHAKAHLARKAYGKAIYELYDCFYQHTKDGLPVTLKDVQDAPELYDGAIGGEACVDLLIFSYLAMIQTQCDDDGIERGPIDDLVAAFDRWVHATCGAKKG